MTERIEQRYCIKFCQKLGDSQSETIRKIRQVFGDNAMGVTQIKGWYNRFKNGRTIAKSNERSGRPQTARNAAIVAKVESLIMRDGCLTVREIAKEVGISKDSVHAVLRHNLNMRRVDAKFVPKLLSEEQTLETANADQELVNAVESYRGS